MRTVLLLVVLVLGAATSMHAQCVVNGLITDRETGDALQGVTVRVEGTSLGAISSAKGRFTISNVPDGRIVLKATMVGYEQYELTLILKRKETKDVIFTMIRSAVQVSDIVVSANKRVQAVQDVPISVAVMTQNDLRERAITQLDDALRYVSGITVARDQVNIRGASGFALGVGSRTMVLLDGFPLISGDNGDIKFDVFPAGQIERIEIVKGAGSALYGTGALGGVVSMFTQRPTENAQISARAFGGIYTPPPYEEWEYRTTLPSRVGADLEYSQSFGALGVSASGNYRQDESYREFDRSRRGLAYAKFTYDADETSTFRLFGLHVRESKQNFLYWEDLRNATRPTRDQDEREVQENERSVVAGDWTGILTPATTLTIHPGVYHTAYRTTVADSTLDSNASSALAYNLEAQLTSRLSSVTVLTTGVNARVNVVGSELYGDQMQNIISAYAQGEYAPNDDLVFTLGARADYEKTRTLEAHFEISPKFGMSWKLSPFLTARASAGRGFRAPTIAERYANIRYGPFNVEPNPNVLSESSWSFETGAHFNGLLGAVPIEADLALFDNELYDLIEPLLPCSSLEPVIQFQNVTRARILGAEATVRAILHPTFVVETGLTGMIPRDLIEDDVLKYRNSILWYSRGMWKFNTWMEVQAEYRFVSRMERIDDCITTLNLIPDADIRVPSHVVDARLIVDAARWLKGPIWLTLIGRNLLDYSYSEIMGNLAPTRSILLQVEWRPMAK